MITLTLFGQQFTLLLLLQVLVTVVIISGFAVFTSFKEKRSDHASDCQAVLLLSFLVKNHTSRPDPASLLGVTAEQWEKTGSELGGIRTRLEQFQKEGKLPSLALAADTTVREHLLAIVLAPVFAAGALVLVLDETRKRVHLIQNTDMRKNFMAKLFLMAVPNAALVAVPLCLADSVTGWVIYPLAALGAAGSACCVAAAAGLIYGQIAWKEFWGNNLFDVMARAERTDDHDLFNRAALLRDDVYGQPDTPIPGNLKFYVVVYSAVQAVLWLIFRE